ncbi:hypothetical protein ElyMa_005874300 [Elysia marginata]|uniref:Uncharacterized protein n=1 Tax=Elysia marginata TaxID=1093978 RepID=A0AAV4G1Y0_9GAST|nr:hypothetical protein ElyMa_005874300 [Elysia marginata]
MTSPTTPFSELTEEQHFKAHHSSIKQKKIKLNSQVKNKHITSATAQNLAVADHAKTSEPACSICSQPAAGASDQHKHSMWMSTILAKAHHWVLARSVLETPLTSWTK